MSLRQLFSTIILFTMVCSSVFAQQNDKDTRLGTWTTVNIQYTFAPKWGVMLELQSRLQEPFHLLVYYEQKGGMYYNINKNFQALLGVGHYATHSEDDFSAGPTTREARLWGQFTLQQYLSRLKFEHRFRAEARWQNRAFNNRFRYRIQLAIPINHDKIEKNTFFAIGSNELFLTTKAPHFARNRAFIGLGYQITKVVGVQAGITNQYNYNLQKAGGKNYLSLTLNIKLEDKSDFPSQVPMKD